MLRNGAASKGRALAARLPVYPRYVFEDGWLDDASGRQCCARWMPMDWQGTTVGHPACRIRHREHQQ